jgi:hypothetical protein
VVQIFRYFCYNRARQRRKLAHALTEWSTLQLEAEALDQLIYKKKVNFVLFLLSIGS